ncbi:MAG: membrane protein insertase YidC, partial [Spirochaetes bacterium]|nr:membrane protein insertase YidC [Spirochaetota bacterium]
MDKKTLLAVVFSVVIIVGGMLIQSAFFPAKKPAAAAPTEQPAAQQTTTQQGQQPAQGQQPVQGQAVTAPAATGQAGAQGPTGGVSPVPFDASQGVNPSAGQVVVRETDLYRLSFSSDGGTLSSVQLKKFKNVDGSLVDMVLLPKNGKGADSPFGISFGDYKAAQRREPFALRESS